jgi:hypothetical protein
LRKHLSNSKSSKVFTLLNTPLFVDYPSLAFFAQVWMGLKTSIIGLQGVNDRMKARVSNYTGADSVINMKHPYNQNPIDDIGIKIFT